MQRRHGQPALLWRSKSVVDNRGNTVQIVDLDTPPHDLKVWVIPGRSMKAEMTGQQDIDVIRIGTTANLAGVDSWSRLQWNGKWYDVVMPPAYHHGTRDVRHWSMDLKKRPG